MSGKPSSATGSSMPMSFRIELRAPVPCDQVKSRRRHPLLDGPGSALKYLSSAARSNSCAREYRPAERRADYDRGEVAHIGRAIVPAGDEPKPMYRRKACGQLRPCALRPPRAPILRGRSGRGRALVMPVLRDYLTVYPSVRHRLQGCYVFSVRSPWRSPAADRPQTLALDCDWRLTKR